MTIETIMNTEEVKLNGWISKVGFHNKKAKYIKDSTAQIVEKHNGKVPSNLKDLCALPGVGLKMAHLVLQCAFD